MRSYSSQFVRLLSMSALLMSLLACGGFSGMTGITEQRSPRLSWQDRKRLTEKQARKARLEADLHRTSLQSELTRFSREYKIWKTAHSQLANRQAIRERISFHLPGLDDKDTKHQIRKDLITQGYLGNRDAASMFMFAAFLEDSKRPMPDGIVLASTDVLSRQAPIHAVKYAQQKIPSLVEDYLSLALQGDKEGARVIALWYIGGINWTDLRDCYELVGGESYEGIRERQVCRSIIERSTIREKDFGLSILNRLGDAGDIDAMVLLAAHEFTHGDIVSSLVWFGRATCASNTWHYSLPSKVSKVLPSRCASEFDEVVAKIWRNRLSFEQTKRAKEAVLNWRKDPDALNAIRWNQKWEALRIRNRKTAD